jgi:hypothetical protein
MTDIPKHNTANSKTSITLFSGIFISVALFFLLILSRILCINKTELDDSAHVDHVTHNTIEPGSVYVTAYGGNTATLISGFTSSKWNHVAVVGEDGLIHEITSGVIKTSELHDWKRKWLGTTIVVLERSNTVQFNINGKVTDLKQTGVKVSVNPVFLSGLLFGVDLDEDTMYCTKFVKHVLDEELPLIPADYVAYNNPILKSAYLPPQALYYIE